MDDSRRRTTLLSLVLVLLSGAVLVDATSFGLLSGLVDALLALFALGTLAVGAFVLAQVIKTR